MANGQHIEWLLEGVEKWNTRRARKFVEIPDFSGSDLREEFEKAGKIEPDDSIPLSGYDLNDADFTDANLNEPDFSCAHLSRAKFENARIQMGIFRNADLSDSNLTGVKFVGAFYRVADFSDANLSRANFSNSVFESYSKITPDFSRSNQIGANFAGANLTRTKLRYAMLFDNKQESMTQYDVKFMLIKSLQDLFKNIQKISACYKNSVNMPRFYFRGESKNIWTLKPSVMREVDYKSNERDMLLGLIARRPGDFNGIASGVGQLVLAQHYGLKTRFLDITRNPLVALFHACENKHEPHCKKDAKLHVFVTPPHMVKPFISDTVSVIANYARLPHNHQKSLIGDPANDSDYTVAMEQLSQLVQSEKSYFVSRIDPKDFYRVIIVEPQQLSERISKQAGAFLVSAFHERFERKEIETCGEGVPPLYAHYQLTIPSRAKPRIVEELRMLDITRESLFPGLDESANAVNEFYSRRSE